MIFKKISLGLDFLEFSVIFGSNVFKKIYIYEKFSRIFRIFEGLVFTDFQNYYKFFLQNDLSNCIRDALFRGDADAEVDRRWLMDALVCTRSALYSERCVNDDDAAASPADDPTLLEQFSDEEERLLLRHRMRAAAVRCTLLTRSHAGDALLAKVEEGGWIFRIRNHFLVENPLV